MTAITILPNDVNNQEADVRAKVAMLLTQLLCDAIDLQTQAKQAHWNVKGPQFISLHKLFDEVYASAAGYVDLLAERAVQLGGIAGGTARIVAERSQLTEYPRGITGGAEHAKALAQVLAEFGANVRRAIIRATDQADQISADICTEISRGVDKWVWQVEAHLQGHDLTEAVTLPPQ